MSKKIFRDKKMNKRAAKARKKARKWSGNCQSCDGRLRRMDERCRDRDCGRPNPRFAGKGISGSFLGKNAGSKVVPVWKAAGSWPCPEGCGVNDGSAKCCPACGYRRDGSPYEHLAKFAPGAGLDPARRAVAQADPGIRADLLTKEIADAARTGGDVLFTARALGYRSVHEASVLDSDPGMREIFRQHDINYPGRAA